MVLSDHVVYKTQDLQNSCVLASLGIENIQMLFFFVEEIFRKRIKSFLKYEGCGNVASQYTYSPYQNCFTM